MEHFTRNQKIALLQNERDIIRAQCDYLEKLYKDRWEVLNIKAEDLNRELFAEKYGYNVIQMSYDEWYFPAYDREAEYAEAIGKYLGAIYDRLEDIGNRLFNLESLPFEY